MSKKYLAKRFRIKGKWRYKNAHGRWISKDNYVEAKRLEKEFQSEKVPGPTGRANGRRPGIGTSLRSTIRRLGKIYKDEIPKPNKHSVAQTPRATIHTYYWQFSGNEGLEAAQYLNLLMFDHIPPFYNIAVQTRIGSGYGKGAEWVGSPWFQPPAAFAKMSSWFHLIDARPSISEFLEDMRGRIWVEYSIISLRKLDL